MSEFDPTKYRDTRRNQREEVGDGRTNKVMLGGPDSIYNRVYFICSQVTSGQEKKSQRAGDGMTKSDTNKYRRWQLLECHALVEEAQES